MGNYDFQGKRVLVVGAGTSGIAAALVLKNQGALVILNDAKEKKDLKGDLSLLSAAGINLIFGRQDEELLAGIDCLVVSPGVPIGIDLIRSAKERGITVMSEIEAAYRLCPAEILAVTGTNGKTTTTALLAEMMKTAGRDVVVGGNIGTALSEVTANAAGEGIVVAEVSSFQLEGVISFRPHVAVLLNITPDHLDRHYSMENYQTMKERIFANQGRNDFAVLNYDDKIVRPIGPKVASQVIYFSRREELEHGVFVSGGNIKLVWGNNNIDICHIDDIRIKGWHNVENAMAASAAAFFAGADPAAIRETLRMFPGVEHRIELAGEINGVSYYNDSKATNPESAIKALETFPGNIILIAGGRDKNTDLTEFMSLAREKVDCLILLGEAKERFAGEASKHGLKNIKEAETFAGAVNLACQMAKTPQVVLLSPACASYDMFDNYEERGRVFKRLVSELASAKAVT